MNPGRRGTLEPFGPLSQPCCFSCQGLFPATPSLYDLSSQAPARISFAMHSSWAPFLVTAALWGCVWPAQACHMAALAGGTW